MACTLGGKAIVVTGAGGGIGEATARLAAALGAQVLVNDLNGDAAETVAREIREAGGDAVSNAGNIGQWATGQALVAAALKASGRLDGRVNNAGVFRIAPLAETTEDDMRATFGVNVLGSTACAQAAARHMLAQGSGSIVNIVSGAQCGMHGLTAYGASKGALATLTYTWAVELAGSGVRVNAVSPMANTQMSHQTRDYQTAHAVPLSANGPPPSANAPAICYLLTDAAAGLNGQVVRISGSALTLMTHPAILAPVLENPSWTVDAIADAFEGPLAIRHQPLGVVQAALA